MAIAEQLSKVKVKPRSMAIPEHLFLADFELKFNLVAVPVVSIRNRILVNPVYVLHHHAGAR